MTKPHDDPQIKDLVRRLRSALDPCTIYLFGSRAAGDAPPDSDFDVMVVVPETAESSYERRLRGWEALGGFAHPVDLLIYTEAEWEFLSPKRYSVARQVKDHGIVLHAA